MTTENIMISLRQMAWERAKGELRGLLHTYWRDDEQFDEVSEKIEAFISDLDDNELG